MAQYRQPGTERYGALHHHQHNNSNLNGTTSFDHVSIGIRAAPYNKQSRARRSARADRSCWRVSIGSGIIVLSLVLFVTVLAYLYISGYSNDDDTKEINKYQYEEDESKNDLDFLTNVTRTDTYKVLQFGKGSTAHGRDSRYWDKDDRRRDDDYNEDVVKHVSTIARGEYHRPVKEEIKNKVSGSDLHKGSDRKGVGLYNEAGRNELKMYEAEYEASLKSLDQSGNGNGKSNQENARDFGVNSQAVDTDDGYDDDLEFHDTQFDEYDDTEHNIQDHSDVAKVQNEFHHESSNSLDAVTVDQNTDRVFKETSGNLVKDSSLRSQKLDNDDAAARKVTTSGGQSTQHLPKSKKKPKRRKHSGSCEMKLANSTSQLVEPIQSRKFQRFSLQYKKVEAKPEGEAEWGPRFAGHQSLQEREESFFAQDQKINCGFVKGPEGYPSTGFDLAEDDENYISRCHIAVVSCIFGNSDRLRMPAGKMVTRSSKKNVCFVMFMDELTLETLTSEGQVPDRTGFIGLWKIVVVKNLPYTDMRRVGKIPKLLPHRLFPFARYSIWLDSKLRLQLDPMLILEYFLWRKGHEYAISNHYDRHCVWEEVAQNKKLNKYNHTVIDQQFEFYQADGLKRFNASDPDKLLPSNVPEGSFIVRAHTPMSNLFSCLWFNEVDRFTSRDQLSFAYTYQKLRRMNPGKPFHLHMFKDCERRSIAKLFRHRAEEKRTVHREAVK